MLSNASMQQKKQNTPRLGSALTGSPSEPRSHQSITSDWQSTEVSDSTVFEREALHPQPISCQEDRLCRSTLPLPTKCSTVAATFPDSAAVLLRHSVVIDVHSERNGTNRLTVSFGTPRQHLPGDLLIFRSYNVYLEHVRIRSGCDPLEDISRGASLHQRFSQYEAHGLIEVLIQIFFEISLVRRQLRLVIHPCVGGNFCVGNTFRRRHIAGLVLRSAALKEFEMSGVGEVVDLFRLPRMQPLTVVADGSAVAGCCYLFGECHGIAREVEGFGGEHTCGLVVVVIFACNVEWEPRQDYFWSCETH